jgi:purine nucleosidase
MKRAIVTASLLGVTMLGELAMGQRFPAVAESQRIEMLKSPAKRPVRMVLDTDTYNEIDDQFALVYALISP